MEQVEICGSQLLKIFTWSILEYFVQFSNDKSSEA